ncbi:hypothetical protein GGF31_008634 [Allomyces arbusculus]|nr:hypothetical protein GGF31_008634 [Allomyces arbusculus]
MAMEHRDDLAGVEMQDLMDAIRDFMAQCHLPPASADKLKEIAHAWVERGHTDPDPKGVEEDAPDHILGLYDPSEWAQVFVAAVGHDAGADRNGGDVAVMDEVDELTHLQVSNDEYVELLRKLAIGAKEHGKTTFEYHVWKQLVLFE